MHEHNGLTGKTINVKHKQGHTDAYPWNGIAVPVLITEEHPNFYVGTVLPHHAPGGFGISQPYNVTLDKHDLKVGNLIIVGGK